MSSDGIRRADEAGSALVADAVVAELREVLNTADLDADVTVRHPSDPLLVMRDGPQVTLEDILHRRQRGVTVVIDLPLSDSAVLAQLLKDDSDD